MDGDAGVKRILAVPTPWPGGARQDFLESRTW